MTTQLDKLIDDLKAGFELVVVDGDFEHKTSNFDKSTLLVYLENILPATIAAASSHKTATLISDSHFKENLSLLLDVFKNRFPFTLVVVIDDFEAKWPEFLSLYSDDCLFARAVFGSTVWNGLVKESKHDQKSMVIFTYVNCHKNIKDEIKEGIIKPYGDKKISNH